MMNAQDTLQALLDRTDVAALDGVTSAEDFAAGARAALLTVFARFLRRRDAHRKLLHELVETANADFELVHQSQSHRGFANALDLLAEVAEGVLGLEPEALLAKTMQGARDAEAETGEAR